MQKKEKKAGKPEERTQHHLNYSDKKGRKKKNEGSLAIRTLLHPREGGKEKRKRDGRKETHITIQ